MRSLNPYDITAIRFLVNGPILFRLRLHGIRWLGPIIMVCGAGSAYVVVFNLGMTFSLASNAGVITPGFNIIVSTIGLYLLTHVLLGRTRFLGVLLILAGMVIVGVDRIAHVEMESLLGDLLFALSGSAARCTLVSVFSYFL